LKVGGIVDDFREICLFTKELVDKKIIIPHILSTKQLTFRFSEEKVKKLLNSQNLDEKQTMKALHVDIPKYLIGILDGGTDLIVHMALDSVSEGEKESTKERILTKISDVESILLTPALINNYKVKSTTKTNLLKDISWDINERLYHNQEGHIDRARFINLFLETITSDDGFPYNTFNPFRDLSQNSSSLTLTLEDVDFLINELQEMRRVILVEE
jgi:hypothetical protein